MGLEGSGTLLKEELSGIAPNYPLFHEKTEFQFGLTNTLKQIACRQNPFLTLVSTKEGQ